MLKEAHVFSGFSVNDIDTAQRFYGETLGLDVSRDEMGLELKFTGGNHTFVYQKDDHVPATFTILNFVVTDINATIDELTGKGVVMEHFDNLPAPQDDRGVLRGLSAGMGPDIAWFKDPAGNILAVLQDK